MIEDQLREAFARKEAEVPRASTLVRRIDAAAHRQRRRRTVGRVVGAALAVALLAVGAPLAVRQVAPAVVQQLVPGDPTTIPDGALNFVLAGIDGPFGKNDGRRSDTIILVHVPADRSGVQLVTLPRDLEVDLPEYADRVPPGIPLKLNAAYAFGGSEAMTRTVQRLLGVRVDGTVTLDMSQLVRIVDGLGGVPYCLTVEVRSIHTNRRYLPGCHTFTGGELRDVLRQRHFDNGDLQRQHHIAAFLVAVVRRVLERGSFGDIEALRTFYALVRPHASVDLGGIDPVALGWELRPALEHVATVSLPVRINPEHPGTLLPATSGAELLAALRADTLGDWAKAHEDDPIAFLER